MQARRTPSGPAPIEAKDRRRWARPPWHVARLKTLLGAFAGCCVLGALGLAAALRLDGRISTPSRAVSRRTGSARQLASDPRARPWPPQDSGRHQRLAVDRGRRQCLQLRVCRYFTPGDRRGHGGHLRRTVAGIDDRARHRTAAMAATASQQPSPTRWTCARAPARSPGARLRVLVVCQAVARSLARASARRIAPSASLRRSRTYARCVLYGAMGAGTGGLSRSRPAG